MVNHHTMWTTIDIVCAIVDAGWCYLAFKRPDIYPRWFGYAAGGGVLWCLWAATL